MSRDEVRAFDAWAVNELGIPGVVLMENAGRSCAEFIAEKLSAIPRPRVCIFCGTGNNGGDGLVIARHLLNRNFVVNIVICGSRGKIKGDAGINLDILQRLDANIEQLDLNNPDDINNRIAAFAQNADLIVDAVFGTGLAGALRDEYKLLINGINSLRRPILAVDIPSGLDCDTGRPLGAAIKAGWTVTFVAVKKGFARENTNAYTGEIFVASIGIEPSFKQKT